MYDKTIRRRRAVLVLLVAASLILITASFGSGDSGPVRSVQRGFGTVLSPIQDGASRALSPIRDLFGWFGDTISATKELDKARKERDRWQAQAIAAQAASREAKVLRGLLSLQDSPTDVGAYAPVGGRVIARTQTLWNSQITINRGTSDGVERDMPVVAADTGNGAGLVGKVSSVSGGSAIVTLLTNSAMSVGAKTIDGKTTGDIKPRGSDPQDLVLESATLDDNVRVGMAVVTAGTVSSRKDLASIYPHDLPIGRISRIDDLGSETELAHVRPFVRLREIEYVQVLTKPVSEVSR
jgi:rod shape-determining protein MreC